MATADYLEKAKGPFNGEDRALLARLDERTQAMHERLECFVTKEAFRPVALVAYGLMGGVSLSVLGAVIALVID